MFQSIFFIIIAIVLILPLLAQGQNFRNSRNPLNVNIGNMLGLQKPSLSVGFKIGQSCTTPNGKRGTCSNIYESQCSNVLDAIQNWRSNSLKLWNRKDVEDYLRQAIKFPCKFDFEKSDYTLCCSNGPDESKFLH